MMIVPQEFQRGLIIFQKTFFVLGSLDMIFNKSNKKKKKIKIITISCVHLPKYIVNNLIEAAVDM